MRDSKVAVIKAQTAASAATLLAISVMMSSAQAQSGIDVNGEVAVLSGYVFRGLTNVSENDGAAVQAGFEATTGAGLYAGWWASNLGYGTADLTTTVENNIYLGMAGEVAGFEYDVGALYYAYMDDADASGIEPYLRLGVGPVSLGAYYMAQDLSWSNQGDVFFTLGSEVALRDGFAVSLQASYGHYQNRGKYIASTEETGTFRGVEISLAKTLTAFPASMFASYLVGGKDRDGVSQQDKVIVGMALSF